MRKSLKSRRKTKSNCKQPAKDSHSGGIQEVEQSWKQEQGWILLQHGRQQELSRLASQMASRMASQIVSGYAPRIRLIMNMRLDRGLGPRLLWGRASLQEVVAASLQEVVSESLLEMVAASLLEALQETSQNVLLKALAEALQEALLEVLQETLLEALRKPLLEVLLEVLLEPLSEALQKEMREELLEELPEEQGVSQKETSQKPPLKTLLLEVLRQKGFQLGLPLLRQLSQSRPHWMRLWMRVEHNQEAEQLEKLLTYHNKGFKMYPGFVEEVLYTIARGGFGEVHLAPSSSEQRVALKAICHRSEAQFDKEEEVCPVLVSTLDILLMTI